VQHRSPPQHTQNKQTKLKYFLLTNCFFPFLKAWENYVEGQEVANGSPADSKQKEVLKVVVDKKS